MHHRLTPVRLSGVALVILAALPLALAQPVISEFVASNGDTRDDEDGDSSDWIEIHNPGPESIDLGGYALTDDPAAPHQWTIPAGTTLGADAYLIVFASGKDRAVAGEELHTSFALDEAGEYLALRGPDGALVQEFAPAFPEQERDIAYGLASDGSIAYLAPPTPGTANGDPLSGFVADTVFSHKRGFYSAPIDVAITSATPDVQIRYTTNGTRPSPTSGTLYAGPITINATTVLRAIAYKDGMIPTNVDAQSYLFPADIVNQPEMNPTIVNSATYRDEIQPALQAIPVVSLSFNHADLFGFAGIHRNYDQSGRASERNVHFEFFDPADPGDSTHEPGGVRIHGGNSRAHPKKNFRLYFRDDYGNPRLEHDLFPGSPVRSFKHLLLRGGGHDAWTFRTNWGQASLIRNEFLHRVQLAMGQPSPRGRFVNLFLNGQYWGVYELQEFPHEDFNADHHGGQPDDWDVIKHGQEVEAGTRDAWDDLLERARPGIATGGDYDAIQEFLDLDNFADAMIHRIWSSDEDWLSPEFRNGVDISNFSDDKNWYVARRSRNGPGKFIFYSWDAEMSMGIPFAASRSYINDFTRVDNDNSPGIIYDRLRRHPEFQLRFADRLHRHMFHGGALTVPALEALWDPLVSAVQSPMVAESARWGLEAWSGNRLVPYTRNGQWFPAVDWVRSQFIANRSAVVLAQFRAVDLYPDVAAPDFSPAPGTFSGPVEMQLSSATPGATIYFTTDGTDPRLPADASTVTLISTDHPVKVVVPNSTMHSAIGTTWRHFADPANIDAWIDGLNGVGYEADLANTPNFAPVIRTPLDNMRHVNPSAYLRITFDIPDQATIDSLNRLTLRLRYNDGFIAFLNGVRIDSRNANADNWNSAATALRSAEESLEFVSLDHTGSLDLLTPGRNVLAIHGLNRLASSTDFLVQAILEGDTGTGGGSAAPAAQAYSAPVAVTQTTRIVARSRAPSGAWSALSDVLYRIGTPATFGDLSVSEIHYHPTDPATPAELAVSSSDNDFEFLELHNRRDYPLDLSLCRFTDGIAFDIPPGTSLPANGRLLLVSNREAFLARYGPAVASAILGEFAGGTNLSNGGERLTLVTANRNPIIDFSYDDGAPWPITPDGGGPSLVLVDPANTPPDALGDPARWRAALLDFGAPALADEMSYELWSRLTYGPLDGANPDIAGELVVPPGSAGLANLVLFAQGQDLSRSDPASLSTVGVVEENGRRYLTLRFQLRNDLRNVNLIPEVSPDLVTWTPTVVFVAQQDNGNGTSTYTLRDTVPLPDAAQRFVRLRFER